MKFLRWLLIGIVALAMLFGAAVWLADTDWGHRKIADQIAQVAPKSGLRIKIDRIDGSIYGKARLRGLRLSDPSGVFFEAPDVALDWRPASWWNNILQINSLNAPTATLYKLPKLKPGDPDAPILPKFDIQIGRLAIDRLQIEPGVAGDRRVGRVTGKADIEAGRAVVNLDVDAAEGDRLVIALVAEPDRNIFDLDAALNAPSGGVFGAIIGTLRPVAVTMRGDGSWRDWRGRANVVISGTQLADLGVTAQSGRYLFDGRLIPNWLLKGKLQRMTSPSVAVRGSMTLANRRADTQLMLASSALTLDAKGIVDLGSSSFDDMLVNARLLQPQALFPNMTGKNIALKARLDGPFSRAAFEYLLTAPRVAFDQTGFDDLRASGKGRLSQPHVRLPIKLTARRVTGVGDVAGGILANMSVEGLLLVTGKAITGDGLILRSDKLDGRLSLFVDLVTGRYDVGLQGQLQRYLIPGLGIVDVKSELKAVPGEGGRGTRVIGRGQAWVRRFDNVFLSGLAGGLPQVDTRLERGPDGILRLTGLKLSGPAVSFTGNGIRRRDGTFQIDGAGRQARYGNFRLGLDGRIERPTLDIALERPNAAMGLANVRLFLDPVGTGFNWRASGQSRLGPFAGNGLLELPRGNPAVVNFSNLDISGMQARGRLSPVAGGFDGEMNVNGAGISGILEFTPRGNIQAINASLAARDAKLKGPPSFSARRGQFDGTILLGTKGMTIDGTATGQGLELAGVSLARLAANIKLTNGVGELRASFAGARGRAFDLQTVAQISPQRITFIGGGTIDRRPISLTAPAILTPERDGWRMQPAAFTFSGGTARVGGRFGGTAPEIDAVVERMPMTVLDMFFPNLAMGGAASGTIVYRQPAGALPSGKADLRIRGLSRTGLVLASRPIDLGVSAVMNGTTAGARMTAVGGGQTLGRAQVRLTNIATRGDLGTRLSSAPLFAQLRYNGAADTLWRLTGVETFDLSGPVAIGADITGTLANPSIRGSLKTTTARVESAATGMVLSGVQATGRFNGSQLVVDRFSANAGKGGNVTGSGAFDFARRENGVVGIAIDMQANRAELLARDDLAATVTGPLSIRSDNISGVISGSVLLDRSRYRLGRTSAVAGVPRLKVREINSRPDEAIVRAAPNPWRLDLKARAPNRLIVTGLGIDSEWRTDVTIGGSIFAPAISGRAELIQGGYEFAGRRFELERGTIRFNGASPPDPVLDILAQGNTQGLNASIRVTGTGLRPDVSFSSVPALPQEELLARLLFGTSITNLSAPEALQLASAVAALSDGGNGLNPINAVRNAVGLDRLRILPADTVTGARTSVAAGKYLGRRTYVEIITDGQGYSATRAEFQVTRWLSLLSSISTIGRQSATVRVSKDY
jgi:translocation and assembly module TamB